MTATSQGPTAEQGVAWAKRELQHAIDEFLRKGLVKSALIEAKPAWAFPFKIVIGRVREQGTDERFFWLIQGDLPFDYLMSDVAGTPREAARHFALKWQLKAARHRDSTAPDEPESDSRRERLALAAELEAGAEALYEFVRDDSLWTDA